MGLFSRNRGGRSSASRSKSSKKKSTARRSARFRRQFAQNIRRVTIFVTLLVLGAGLLTIGIRTVLDVKKNSTDQNESEQITMLGGQEGEVLGIQGVPIYPGTTFLYDNYIESDEVQKFLFEGKSAYHLPYGIDWDDVVEFYKKELGELGWSHTLSVDISDDDRVSGEYWVLNEGENEITGLHVYQRVNDIWFENISPEQARSGRADLVAQEREIEFILEMGSASELPSGFPWKLKFPSRWDADMKKSQLLDIEMIEFIERDSNVKVILEPVDFESMESLEEIGRAYLDQVNTHRDEADFLMTATVTDGAVAGQDAKVFLLALSSDEGSTGHRRMCVFVHPNSGVVYVLTDFAAEQAFSNYIMENLEVG